MSEYREIRSAAGVDNANFRLWCTRDNFVTKSISQLALKVDAAKVRYLLHQLCCLILSIVQSKLWKCYFEGCLARFCFAELYSDSWLVFDVFIIVVVLNGFFQCEYASL